VVHQLPFDKGNYGFKGGEPHGSDGSFGSDGSNKQTGSSGSIEEGEWEVSDSDLNRPGFAGGHLV
jgi:hypothetical protein